MIYTTFKPLREHDACVSRYRRLAKRLGVRYYLTEVTP